MIVPPGILNSEGVERRIDEVNAIHPVKCENTCVRIPTILRNETEDDDCGARIAFGDFNRQIEIENRDHDKAGELLGVSLLKHHDKLGVFVVDLDCHRVPRFFWIGCEL